MQRVRSGDYREHVKWCAENDTAGDDTLDGRVAVRPLLFLLPLLLTLLFHLPALFSQFVWDDVGLIQKHPLLSEPSFITSVFSRDYGLEMTSREPSGYYRPMLMVVNWTLYRLFGPSPLAYHLFSILVAGASASFLSWLLLRLRVTSSPFLAIAAGALLAAHPMRTELAQFFMSLPDLVIEIGGLVAIFSIAGSGRPGNWPWRLAACAMTSLVAALFKETAYFVFSAMAAAALLHGVVRRSRFSLAGGVGLMAGLIPAYLLRTMAGIQSVPSGHSLAMLFGEGACRAFHFGATSIARIVLPSSAIFMDWSDYAAGFAATAGVVLLILTASGVVLGLALRRSCFPVLVASWFAAGLANVMLVTAMHIPFADRYCAVLPGVVGMGLVGGWLIRRATGRISDFQDRYGRLGRWLLALYIGLHAAYGLSASAKCLSPVSFFTAMAEENPDMAYPRVVLASIMFYDLGDFERCEKYAREVMALMPDTKRGREMGKLLAKRYIAESRFQEALDQILWAEAGLAADPEVHSLKAISLFELGRSDEARASIEKALALAPENTSYRKQREKIIAGVPVGGVP